MTRDGTPSTRGRLDVICGCMFSGKTSLLITRLLEAQAAGRRVLAFKHVLDARYDATMLATHDSLRFPARTVRGVEALAAQLEDARRETASAGSRVLIGVDEAQFFGNGLEPLVARLRQAGIDLVLAGIDYDAWGRPFAPLPALKALADEVSVLTAPCGVCANPARLSQRMTPLGAEDDMVGGPGAYEPRCPACFVPLSEPAPACP